MSPRLPDVQSVPAINRQRPPGLDGWSPGGRTDAPAPPLAYPRWPAVIQALFDAGKIYELARLMQAGEPGARGAWLCLLFAGTEHLDTNASLSP